MKQNLYVLKASGNLSRFEDKIKSTSEKIIQEVKRKITLPDVDIVVVDNPNTVIPETGVGGFTPFWYLLYLSIDPNSPNLEEILESEVRSALAHELYHCARWKVCGYDGTLLEALMSEGLADHFDSEINGTNPRPWSTALDETQLKIVGNLAKQEFHSKEYNHAEWFFGTNKNKIPRWAGYSLGFHFLQNYMHMSGKQAGELVAVPAMEIAKEIKII